MHQSRHIPRVHRQHRGFTLLELMLSLALLGLFAALLSPLLLASARERRTAMQEQLALQLAANALEVLTKAPPTPSAEPMAVPVPDELSRWLPNVRQTAQAETIENGQRITVGITWDVKPGVAHKPVRLEGWAFSAGEQP